jgi:cob(I)alamin adenosyltransferase
MKVYTKTGDKGKTALIGGTRVDKDHARIEVYGTVDELISYIGLIRDQHIKTIYKDQLVHIQDRLMVIASILATDCDDCGYKIPELETSNVIYLEEKIDEFDTTLRPLTSFILPGGHQTVSFCHIARNVCRRTERLTITLARTHFVPEVVIQYLNRLSDYLFTLSRVLSKELNAEEIPWKPQL